MKKFALTITLLCLVFFLFGCSSSPKPGESELPDIVKNARSKVPEDVLLGIGSASLSTQHQSKTVAETRARAEISRALDSVVQDMIRDYTASSEVDPQAAIAFQENITVALSQARLQGARISDEDWIDGTYYVIMYLDKSNIATEISNAQAAARLRAPAMASFDAEARMNEAFDKLFSQEPSVNNRD